MSILKKSLLTFFAFLILASSSLTLFAQSAHAQFWYNQTYNQWEAIVDSGAETELYGERYTAAQVRWILYSLVYIVTNNPFMNCLKFTSNPVLYGSLAGSCTDVISIFWDSLTTSSNTSNNSLATLISQPISSSYYFNEIGSRLHLVPEAQAQGFGFESAAVVFTIWEASRNTSYALLIVVIVIMAFMIMFRVKLSPQTVISVQSALPKVIVTLILITFSYAIAGLMIDLMYVAIGLLTTILRTSGLVGVGPNSPPLSITWGQLFAELTYANGAFGLMFKYLLLFMGALYMATLSSIGGLLATIGTVGLLQPILIIVMFIVVMILGFKVWWMLLKNFVMIILSISFGPFQILFGALGSGGFGPWVKNLAGLLSVYPTTGFMFVLSFIFLRGASSNTLTDFFAHFEALGFSQTDLWPFDVSNILSGGNSWVPPLTGSTTDLDIVWLGVSLAILALTPKTAEMIKGFMTGRPLAYGTAIGEGLAFAAGTATGAAKGGMYMGIGAGAQYLERTAPIDPLTKARTGWRANASSTIRKMSGIK